MFTKLRFFFAAMLAHQGAAEVLRETRHLSYELIAGYEPSSVVTDHVSVSFAVYSTLGVFVA